jgi:hypothetical protein
LTVLAHEAGMMAHQNPHHKAVLAAPQSGLNASRRTPEGYYNDITKA